MTLSKETIGNVIEKLEHFSQNLKWTDVRGAQDLLAAADGLRELLERRERDKQEPVAWIYEDELPESYPYDAMFPYSKVDVVRMFPVFAPPATVAYPAPKDSGPGWKIDPDFLNKVQESIGYDEECECWEGTPSMEMVEAVLLAASKLAPTPAPVAVDEIAKHAGIDPAIADAYMQGCHDSDMHKTAQLPDEKRDDDGNNTSDFDHGWNACRAAMLQSGTPTNEGTIPDSSSPAAPKQESE